MMTDEGAPPRVRCRAIADGDIEAVVQLLRRGFPSRAESYWRNGFARQRERPLPDGVPRYGFTLVGEEGPVGVVLLLYAVVDGALRANLSSWYVDPAYRAQASLLVTMAIRRKDVTFINISPARNTWRTIEAQGFRRSTSGQFLGMPVLSRGSEPATVRRFDPERDVLPESDLLIDHARMGALCLVVEARGGLVPIVLLPFRIRSGRVRLPIYQIIFCRSIETYVRLAGPIGRYLLRRGIAFVIHDADGPEPGLFGHYRADMGPKYALGPHPPRRGDLAYTERVIFGP